MATVDDMLKKRLGELILLAVEIRVSHADRLADESDTWYGVGIYGGKMRVYFSAEELREVGTEKGISEAEWTEALKELEKMR